MNAREQQQAFDGHANGAIFNDDRSHRYLLWRSVDDRPRLGVIMVNPSKADESTNDPTVSVLAPHAYRLGFGGIWIVNLFSLISTDPRGLREADRSLRDRREPLAIQHIVGIRNDAFIEGVIRNTDMVLVARGAHGGYLLRDREILMKLSETPGRAGVPRQPVCLGTTKDGAPWHPLRKKLGALHAYYDGNVYKQPCPSTTRSAF